MRRTRRKSSAAGKGAARQEADARRPPRSGAEEGAFRPVGRAVAEKMIEALCRLYPEAECELDFQNDYQLLTAVILSAQTTDSQVNKVTPLLFQRYPEAKDLACADPDEVRSIIRPTGYFNAKAKNIMDCAKAIVERFGGQVPSSLADLVTLPGVGRKTANVVLGVAHGQPGWTVDTHVKRLARRLGFSGQTDPYKIELDLQKLFPGQDWSKLSITLIWHGRRMCHARNPNCAGCPLASLCPSSRL